MSNQRALFWSGLYLVACGWQFLLPLLSPPHYVLGSALVVMGAVVNGIALLDSPGHLSRQEMVAYGVGAALATLLAPLPGRLGGLLLLAGVTLLWFRPAEARRGGFARGVLLTGIMQVALSLCTPVLWSVASVFHQMGFVAPIVGEAFKFFGYEAHGEAGSVFVQGAYGIQEYTVSTEYFGWMFLMPAMIGALVWHILGPSGQRLRGLLMFPGAALVYALVRYIFLGLLYLDLPAFPLFWSPWMLCISFLPLFLFLSIWPAASQWAAVAADAAPSANLPRRWALGMVASALAMLCLVGGWGWEDPGRTKTGRLIIDEGHSAWEKTNRPYDTEWYGEESGYNYYCLAQFLGYYYQVRHNSAKITDTVLADCDILVLKTPTSAFAPEEIDAVERFVRRGGGLLLIGDHTNVFGMSTYLNGIARRFGLHYNYDATYDLPTGGLSLYERPRLLAHPIVQWLPPFLFGTSCTLDVPPGAAIPMQGYALRVAGHDYAATSFFTKKTDGPHIGFGLFPQLGAVKCQRGRVAAFTDSTVFSNFWMFMPGKPELLLGCTEWLNRENRYAPRSVILFGLGLLLAIGAGFGLRGRERFPYLFAAGSAGFFAGVYLTGAANRAAYPQPAARSCYPTICFEQQYSRFDLPADELIHPPNRDFHTLYVWVERLGYVPRVCAKLEQAMKEGRGLVMLNPAGTLPQRTVDSLNEYVQQGGVLYVFDSPTNGASAASQILGSFGLGLRYSGLTNQSVFNAAGEQVAADRAVGLTFGGEGKLFTAQRQATLATARVGNGAVVFSGDAELFANSSLGTTSTVPDKTQKRLYRVIFELFRQIETKGKGAESYPESAPATVQAPTPNT